MKCNYCNTPTKWVSNEKIYGKKYGKSYMVWWCQKCDAYVGCHNNTKKPLGSLANKGLRELRKSAKNVFIKKFLGGNWSCSKKQKDNAYDFIDRNFKKDFHFGSSTKQECLEFIDKFDK